MRSRPIALPQSPGLYIWHILDLSYLEVGLVEVRADSEKHLEYIRKKYAEFEDKRKLGFYIYQNDSGQWLTMYHQASPHHVPACDGDGRPYVDGYRTTSWEHILGE